MREWKERYVKEKGRREKNGEEEREVDVKEYLFSEFATLFDPFYLFFIQGRNDME